MRTSAQQTASRPCASQAKRKSADSNPRRHASAQRHYPCPSVATRLGSTQKKDSAKSPLSGTPLGSRSLRRPAGRNVLRGLIPCASGHTFPPSGLQPVDPKNLRLRHPKKTQEKPKKTQENPRKPHGNPRKTRRNPGNPTTPAERPLSAPAALLRIRRDRDVHPPRPTGLR